jgi:hypothetical protein
VANFCLKGALTKPIQTLQLAGKFAANLVVFTHPRSTVIDSASGLCTPVCAEPDRRIGRTDRRTGELVRQHPKRALDYEISS